jgi:hypothetical protein
MDLLKKIILLLLKTKLNFFHEKIVCFAINNFYLLAKKHVLYKNYAHWRIQTYEVKNTTRTTYFIDGNKTWWIFKFQKRI